MYYNINGGFDKISSFCFENVAAIAAGHADLPFMTRRAHSLLAFRTVEIAVRFSVAPLLFCGFCFPSDLLSEVQEPRILRLTLCNVSREGAEQPIRKHQHADAVKHIMQDPEYQRGRRQGMTIESDGNKSKQDRCQKKSKSDNVDKPSKVVDPVTALHKAIETIAKTRNNPSLQKAK